MSRAGDPLSRLDVLLRDGVIDQGEYDREVAKLGQLNVAPLGSAIKRRVVIAVVVALLVALTYLVASVEPVGDDGAAVPQPVAEKSADATNAPAVATVQEPSSDYQALCIYSGVTPLGTRLSTMADLLSQQGRTISWEATDSDWIMRTGWHDKLTGMDHEEAFEFQRRSGAEPAQACNKPIGELLLSRVARDGMEVTDADPNLASVFYKDVEPVDGGASPSPVEENDATIRQVPIVAKYIRLNERCRGGSGDDPATMDACGRRDALLPEVEHQGYCWGNASDQSEADSRWRRC